MKLTYKFDLGSQAMYGLIGTAISFILLFLLLGRNG